MRKRKNSIIVILAFVFCLSLTACGGRSSSAEAAAMAPPAWEDSGQAEEQDWSDPENYAAQEWSDPENYAAQEWSDPENYAAQEWSDPENYAAQEWNDPENYEDQEWSDPNWTGSEPDLPRMDLNQISLVSAKPMSEGIMWMQYMQDGQNLVSAVREDGTIVITFDEVVKRVTNFDQGVAFVSFVEGNVTKRLGYYELPYDKRNLTRYEIIIDADGNILYDTRYPAAGSGVSEEILCHGNGKFVLLRHESGMTADRWTLGTIDSHGNTVDEFIEYGSTGSRDNFIVSFSLKDLSNKFRSNNSGNYLNGYDYDIGTNTIIPRYRGEGWYVADYYDNRYLFYQPEAQILTTIVSDNDPSLVSGGRVLAHIGSGVYCYDLYNEVSQKIAETGYSYPAYTDSLVYSKNAHAYLDFDGNPVITLTDYPELETVCGPFYGDYAVACLTGVDGNSYAGIIDRSGALQFEPFRVNEVRYTMDGGRFFAKDDDGWKMYDTSGSLINSYSWGWLNWIYGGFAFVRYSDDVFSELAYLY